MEKDFSQEKRASWEKLHGRSSRSANNSRRRTLCSDGGAGDRLLAADRLVQVADDSYRRPAIPVSSLASSGDFSCLRYHAAATLQVQPLGRHCRPQLLLSAPPSNLAGRLHHSMRCVVWKAWREWDIMAACCTECGVRELEAPPSTSCRICCSKKLPSKRVIIIGRAICLRERIDGNSTMIDR